MTGFSSILAILYFVVFQTCFLGSTPSPTTRNTQVYCSPEEYLCRGGRICIKGALFCDGVVDCPSGDDESNCGQPHAMSVHKRETTDHVLKPELSGVMEQKILKDETERGTSTFGINFQSMEDQYNEGKKTHGNRSAAGNETGVNVHAAKLMPRYDYKPIAYSHTGSGFFFINFGTIIDGNENVHGAGNDLGNGNGNGNDNGNGNGGGHAQGAVENR